MTAPTTGHDIALPSGADLMLLAVVGSTAYGLATQTSDVDLLGVYRADLHTILGLTGPAAAEATSTHTDPDYAVHELGKFARLALAGNPTVTELLWAEEHRVLTTDGLALIAAREAFLSETAVRAAYTGYATAQAARIARRTSEDTPRRTRKHARHCARLLLQAEQLLTTGLLTLDVSDHRDELFALGDAAVTDPAGFSDWFTHRMARLESTPSVLPEHPDRERVNDVVVDLRRRQLQA